MGKNGIKRRRKREGRRGEGKGVNLPLTKTCE